MTRVPNGIRKSKEPYYGRDYVYHREFLIATVVAVPCYWQISSDNVFQMSETGLMATKIFAGLCLALGYGLIGYLDDYIKW